MHEDEGLDSYYESQTELPDEPYDGGGWPGDGSGADDLADYNANEADDYAHEGAEDWSGGEDAHLDGMSEE